MPKRERKSCSSSSFNFFCWCMMFLPSPASPNPYLLIVLARHIVALPLPSTAAAHWAIEALQVAVHYENQVVQIFPRGEGDRSQGFRLIHFAVAEECPHFAASRFFEPAIFQVANETRVINRLNRPQAH